ncbi:Fic/DOC family protein [Luteolibacter sp. Populi]|uniref:Fic/DOC family protein n=1 Tax=Luteolibacter sp. Populi TaxID=3230487 RepID=UPI003466D51B
MDYQTGVLRNLANIGDAVLLEEYEGEMSIVRQFELAEAPLASSFDLAHLKAIHHHLFQDVYDWAGEPRTVDIAKGSSRFGSHLHVENFLSKLFIQLSKEREAWKRSPGTVDWPDRFAHYMGEINAAHPFREGNGRTQRLFIGQLAEEHGFEIRWARMSAKQILAAAIASFDGDNGPLKALIAKHLVEKLR